MITIMCMYNDYQTLQDSLLSSLKKQKLMPQLILIDNRKNQYDSHAKAYNAHLDLIENENVIFIHQDVILKDDLFKIIDYLSLFPHAIMGTAGTSKNGITYSSITHGIHEAYAGHKRIKHHNSVETLDEHFFFLKTKIIRSLRFNESIQMGFHLYAVELCLRAKLNDIPIYAVNYNLHHLSKGSIKKDFFNALSNLAIHYQGKVRYLYLTTGLFDIKQIVKTSKLNNKEDFKIQGLQSRLIKFKKRLILKNRLKRVIQILMFKISNKLNKNKLYRIDRLDDSKEKTDSLQFLNHKEYLNSLVLLNCNEGNIYKALHESQIKSIYHQYAKLAAPISLLIQKPNLMVRTVFKNNKNYVPYLDLDRFNQEIIITTDSSVYKYIVRHYQDLKVLYVYRPKKDNKENLLRIRKDNF